MKTEKLKYVGFGTKLTVNETCKSISKDEYREVELQKGEVLIVVDIVSINDNSATISALKDDKVKIMISSLYVELENEPSDTTGSIPIRSEKQLYAGLELVTISNRHLGLAQKVKLISLGRAGHLRVKLDFESKNLFPEMELPYGELAIPKGVKSKEQVFKELISFLENPDSVLDSSDRQEYARVLKTLL